jgi:hypothetical protein
MDSFISIIKNITFSPVDGGQFAKLQVENHDTGNIEEVYAWTRHLPDIRVGSQIRYRESGGVIDKLKVLAY